MVRFRRFREQIVVVQRMREMMEEGERVDILRDGQYSHSCRFSRQSYVQLNQSDLCDRCLCILRMLRVLVLYELHYVIYGCSLAVRNKDIAKNK